MLRKEKVKYYKVKNGQTLDEIAAFFSVAEGLIIRENHLTEAPHAGMLLKIPTEQGNVYIVQAGDTKALLCGSAENYFKKNGTDVFYIGMRVIL